MFGAPCSWYCWYIHHRSLEIVSRLRRHNIRWDMCILYQLTIGDCNAVYSDPSTKCSFVSHEYHKYHPFEFCIVCWPFCEHFSFLNSRHLYFFVKFLIFSPVCLNGRELLLVHTLSHAYSKPPSFTWIPNALTTNWSFVFTYYGWRLCGMCRRLVPNQSRRRTWQEQFVMLARCSARYFRAFESGCALDFIQLDESISTRPVPIGLNVRLNWNS